MRVRRRHVLHVGVILAVVLQLAFAGAFLADASQTNRAYDALAAHRVTVTARTVGCVFVGSISRSGNYSGHVCRVAYSYQGQQFSAVIGFNQTRTFYVDPLDTALRMNMASFDNGPDETTGDLIIAALLLFGALTVTVLHQIHVRRRPPGRARAR
jgi:hypothetical protein